MSALPTPGLSDWVRLVMALKSRFVLRRCLEVGLAPSVSGRVWIHDGGTVRIGDRVTFDASTAPIELHAFPGAEIIIGNDVHLEGGASIEAYRSVTIGDGARLGGYCKVIDNHLHTVRGDRHRRPKSVPVIIEPGAHVGRRAIVFPGAVVTAGSAVRPATIVRGTAPLQRKA
jgi:acetyltransferase-like isoleucine patch superfamily enzyme